MFYEINAFLGGEKTPFTAPHNVIGTPFQKSVWAALTKIPHGETRSYKQIAEQIGRPAAARAVGMACNKNPLPLLIPCHRVVGSNGSLTGFAGGVNTKEMLLNLEKPAIVKTDPVPKTHFKTATASISISTSFGRRATSTQDLA